MSTLPALLFATVCAGSPPPASLVAERVFFDDLGHPLSDTHVVIRVYWIGPHEADQLVGVVGSPTNELNVTVSGGTFFDPAPNSPGSRPPPGRSSTASEQPGPRDPRGGRAVSDTRRNIRYH